MFEGEVLVGHCLPQVFSYRYSAEKCCCHKEYYHTGVSDCRIVAPACDRGFKTCDKPKLKALFNREFFAKHDQMSLSDILLEFF